MLHLEFKRIDSFHADCTGLNHIALALDVIGTWFAFRDGWGPHHAELVFCSKYWLSPKSAYIVTCIVLCLQTVRVSSFHYNKWPQCTINLQGSIKKYYWIVRFLVLRDSPYNNGIEVRGMLVLLVILGTTGNKTQKLYFAPVNPERQLSDDFLELFYTWLLPHCCRFLCLLIT